MTTDPGGVTPDLRDRVQNAVILYMQKIDWRDASARERAYVTVRSYFAKNMGVYVGKASLGAANWFEVVEAVIDDIEAKIRVGDPGIANRISPNSAPPAEPPNPEPTPAPRPVPEVQPQPAMEPPALSDHFPQYADAPPPPQPSGRAPPRAPAAARGVQTIINAVLLLGLLTLGFMTARLAFAPRNPDLSNCDANSLTCYDSGWIRVSGEKSSAFFFRHTLGSPPRIVMVSFSPTPDGARSFPLTWNYPRPEAGNPITIEARSDMVLLNIWGGAALHGIYDGTTEQWTTFKDGYFRVVAFK